MEELAGALLWFVAGHATTNLATWYGGAAFALGIAIVRFFGVR